ncbi:MULTISPECIES: MBL fold metallo-hydrolase [Limibacillus]|uniref:Phosphoribosyl 1,2-cyclic phosphodiesterase n=1 Tax=Limibacillus halophilus TaxID=1579333 RepID=A0A839SQ83_9PROT|nr:MBL fold metallo-hydrolase [Limibacillus halophilus]MBB3063910.1 phosphoribosyl 1,2-cyclic phosphodiesterase [Limibacillus halophilus]
MAQGKLTVKFWGVRGSIACSGPQYVKYGGNTSCLEIEYGQGGLAILDAGTGLRELGARLCEQGLQDADIFLTHTHMDHIAGIPFFQPFFRKGSTFRLHAGHLLPDQTLEAVICHFMKAPLFPIPPAIFNADLAFVDFKAGETLRTKDGLTLKTAPLNHPNGATGYRIEYAGKSICYVTDTEHTPGRRDQTIIDLVRGADIMIYDCSYTDDEYPRFSSWGHSTWQEGVRLCEAADVGQLAIFHHDPSHDDAFMDRIAKEAEALRPGTIVAREGMVLTP